MPALDRRVDGRERDVRPGVGLVHARGGAPARAGLPRGGRLPRRVLPQRARGGARAARRVAPQRTRGPHQSTGEHR